MRVLTKLSTALLLFAALFVFTPDARADGVVIVTGGSLTTGNFAGGSFTLAGQNFNLNGGVNFGPGLFTLIPGSSYTARSFNLGLDLRGGQPGIVNGVSYERLHYDGFLSFSAGLTIPFDNAPSIVLTVPFALTGQLRVCTSSTFSGCPAGYIFDAQLMGSGVATIELVGYQINGVHRYDLRSVRYDIQAPAQTPEPATLLLLGTALTALGASARRRRRARREE